MIDPQQQELLRRIPAVDQLLQRPLMLGWVERTSRAFVVSGIQRSLRNLRDSILLGQASDALLEPEVVEQRILHQLRTQLTPALRPVVNATGVILHTNLGRAPQSSASRESLSAASARYTNLEFDLETGERWHRDKIVEGTLCELLGCEAAVVVNNCAAAVFLVLNTLARGREVIVSRGELIEIGGSFRLPDIMNLSGAVLREVGTTNRTRLSDYEAAIRDDTSLLLRVHPSNYRIRGFTTRPELQDLVGLVRARGLHLYEDVGSGCLVDLKKFGIREEPSPRESLAAGADLVSFSADKLLGGPQAGIIAGSASLIGAIRRNPLMRAVRVEKLIYAALGATLTSYVAGREFEEIPVLSMIASPPEELLTRSRRFLRRLRKELGTSGTAELVEGNSVIGGGSCPDTGLPTTIIAIEPSVCSAADLESRLRGEDPGIVVRVEEDRVLLDLRTVFIDQEAALLAGVVLALRG